MLHRLSAFIVWALVAATAVFWGLRLLARPQPAPAYAVTVGEATTMRGDLSRLFGAAPVAAAAEQPAAPELASRFKLLGIMAPKPAAAESAHRSGYALIAVDGKPARAFAVGSSLDSGLVLQAVSLRTASIGPLDGAAAVKLEMPALPAPATGTLPPMSGGVPSAAPANVPPPSPVPPPMPSVTPPVPGTGVGRVPPPARAPATAVTPGQAPPSGGPAGSTLTR